MNVMLRRNIYKKYYLGYVNNGYDMEIAKINGKFYLAYHNSGNKIYLSKFTKEDYKLLEKLELPVKNCIINTIFEDARNKLYYRLKYCKENCQYKCIKGLDYKTIEYQGG